MIDRFNMASSPRNKRKNIYIYIYLLTRGQINIVLVRPENQTNKPAYVANFNTVYTGILGRGSGKENKSNNNKMRSCKLREESGGPIQNMCVV
jgi:hypothetical protein